jgi:prepilin-type processing-associated H-X9-DG protein
MDKYIKAYTRIEILVVIAIISTLAAILFPVFARVKGKAREAVCLSNLKQLGSGVFMYCQDYDDHFPWGVDAIDKYTESWSGSTFKKDIKSMDFLSVVLKPYMNSRDIWLCPSSNGVVTSEKYTCDYNINMTKEEKMSYLYTTILPISRKNISNVTGTFLGIEMNTSEIGVIYDGNSIWHDANRRNVFFADGHASSVTDARFYTIRNIDF